MKLKSQPLLILNILKKEKNCCKFTKIKIKDLKSEMSLKNV